MCYEHYFNEELTKHIKIINVLGAYTCMIQVLKI